MRRSKQTQNKNKKNGGSMKKQILVMLVILLLGVTANIFAQELQVEGDLQVQGTINASNNRVTNVAEPVDNKDAINTTFLRNSVQDNGPWEYKIIFVRSKYASQEYTSGYGWQYTDTGSFESSYKEIGDSSFSGDFENFLNTLALEGWYVDKIDQSHTRTDNSGHSYYVYLQYIIKRKITE